MSRLEKIKLLFTKVSASKIPALKTKQTKDLLQESNLKEDQKQQEGQEQENQKTKEVQENEAYILNKKQFDNLCEKVYEEICVKINLEKLRTAAALETGLIQPGIFVNPAGYDEKNN